MSAMARAIAAVVLVAAVAALFGGCGSDENESTTPAAGEEAGTDTGTEADAEAEGAATSSLPAEDSAAFIQLATTVGRVRALAAVVAAGKPGQAPGDAPTADDLEAVRGLRPHNAILVRVKAGVIALLADVPSDGEPSASSAHRLLRRTEVLRDRLERYTDANPEAAALVPD